MSCNKCNYYEHSVYLFCSAIYLSNLIPNGLKYVYSFFTERDKNVACLGGRICMRL